MRKALNLLLGFTLIFLPQTGVSFPTHSPQIDAAAFDGNEDPSSVEELIEHFASRDLISRALLTKVAEKFHKASLYLGDPESVKAMTLSLFRQWLYLQSYKNSRYRYLLVNASKVVVFSETPVQQFQIWFPDHEFADFPELNRARIALREQIRATFGDKLKEYRDTVLGNLEGVYVTQALLKRREQQARERFRPGDNQLNQTLANLERWQTMNMNSQGLVKTTAFKNYVQPHLAELKDFVSLSEQASSQFAQKFSEFVEEKSKVSDLTEFVSGDPIIDLAKDLVMAMKSPSAVKFRARIKRAFPSAAREVHENIDFALERFSSSLDKFNLVENLITSNTQSRIDNSDFHDFLIEVFQEQVLHWILTEEKPFMKRAADDLTTLVNHRIRDQSLDSAIRLSVLTSLLAITPLSRVGNQFSGWMSRRLFQGFRASLLVGNAYVLSQFAFETYRRYSDWRLTKRLSRLSIDGRGLLNQAQESAAFWSLAIQGGLTGISALASMANLKNLFLSSDATRQTTSSVTRAAIATWNGKPIDMKVWARRINVRMAQVKRTLNASDFKATAKGVASIAMDVSAIFTQMIVMVPASLPRYIKTLLGSIPKQIYQGVTLGTVMGVMGVTVQSYISALGLKSFVWAFDQLGFVPPAYWQTNTLNAADRVKRDAIIKAEQDIIYTKTNIANQVGFITTWEALIQQGQLSRSQQRNLKAAIENGRENIKAHLKMQLLKWYLVFEYRRFVNSAMKDNGFGLRVSPNMENPNRMTIFIRIGEELYSYSATASQLDRLRDQIVVPNTTDAGEYDDVVFSLGGGPQ